MPSIGETERLIPTESLRETVLELASAQPVHSLEGLGDTVANHLLAAYEHLSAANVGVSEDILVKVPSLAGGMVGQTSGERRSTQIRATQGGVTSVTSRFHSQEVLRAGGGTSRELRCNSVEVEWDFYR